MTKKVKRTSVGIFYSFLDMYVNSINAKKKKKVGFCGGRQIFTKQ